MMVTVKNSIALFFFTVLLLKFDNGVHASCTTKPVEINNYSALHTEFCDQRISSELDKLQTETMECGFQTSTLSSIYDHSVAICNTQLASEGGLCDINTQMQRTTLAECSEKCFRPLQLESIKTSEIVKLATGSYFLSSPTQQMNWHMADQFCKSNGLELASVETIKENDALVAAFG
ncbi:Hypothetical predicted protein [Cloeon dipterum]|uniref:C-type lectin domain-containing protein n=1 Tax=Cloeon dipterum TaxID=197152 RepID=A0A8S1DN20_9INSE|nr:Hypothetical predicted protein [Cloeon dipterum]